MSDNNRDGKRAARERLQVERDKQQAREKRKRTMIVAAGLVGVLALAGVVALIAAKSGDGGDGGSDTAGPVVAPGGVSGENGTTVTVGADDAPSTLTVWEDFRCPACAQFENVLRGTIHELVNSGQVKVEYNFATLIDDNLRGSGSLRATNAVACAQDAGKFPAYHDVLYMNQPQETDDAFGKNSRLIELAGKVDGLSTDAFKKCVEDGEHDSWVRKSNKAFQEGKFNGTPTVELNGEPIFPKKGDEPISQANLKKWVVAANQGKPAGTVTQTPFPSGT